ncbi:hypothetical protein FPHOBKDP_00188 [Listeria phage LPJP1]|nr:hypothetical protein FPHOBKDP_00188 [Listeria phage LPJP1]
MDNLSTKYKSNQSKHKEDVKKVDRYISSFIIGSLLLLALILITLNIILTVQGKMITNIKVPTGTTIRSEKNIDKEELKRMKAEFQKSEIDYNF